MCIIIMYISMCIISMCISNSISVSIGISISTSIVRIRYQSVVAEHGEEDEVERVDEAIARTAL